VVPGGRFEESYYWDSYWIIRGLLICDMTETAWGVISNLLEDVTNFGFVPNGGRIYYLDRSQPPLLTLMIAEYLNHVGWSSDEGKSVLQQTFSLPFKSSSERLPTIIEIASLLSTEGLAVMLPISIHSSHLSARPPTKYSPHCAQQPLT
jgi:hypothetical protein